MLSTAVAPARIAEARGEQARCARSQFGVAPDVKIEGRTDLDFEYVPDHAFYILLELLKNRSERASCEARTRGPAGRQFVTDLADGTARARTSPSVSDEGVKRARRICGASGPRRRYDGTSRDVALQRRHSRFAGAPLAGRGRPRRSRRAAGSRWRPDAHVPGASGAQVARGRRPPAHLVGTWGRVNFFSGHRTRPLAPISRRSTRAQRRLPSPRPLKLNRTFLSKTRQAGSGRLWRLRAAPKICLLRPASPYFADGGSCDRGPLSATATTACSGQKNRTRGFWHCTRRARPAPSRRRPSAAPGSARIRAS